ncbi:MAG TPA: glutamate formimidoyltransferase [Candidatus Eremiobacteraeota bacterium]|nr:MAG: Methenyltetrahydrofolate cyclohydrolase [bacterium ADurb.Bin363]HPZ10486.1 glutamate formimidoyltransferase [Candidatus Eremiobacteraeota bacterium]
MKLVECVPNFSEGRNKSVIDAITKEIQHVPDITLLDVDPGADTNRTVVTFIGSPEQIKIAAFNAIKKAAELIDMAGHKGAHARIGATDVCPLIPVREVTMEECVKLANELGKKVGEELHIPVYLYEEAAKSPERKNLATIRQGEYEGLKEKLNDPLWKPDYGEAIFNSRAGATVIGAREFLIAYNVNLNTKDKKLAREIAMNIREAGRAKRDGQGKILKDEKGNTIKISGTLKAIKAVGWYIEEYGQCQVSINLTNYRITPPHIAFEEIRKEADKLGVLVTGSEIVGLIPEEAMLMAGKYFLEKQGQCPGVPKEEIINIAIKSMGLNQLYPFEPKKKIIEYRVTKDEANLIDLSLSRFIDEVSTSSPAPGGGSVSSLCGALSAALSSMVANLTYGKKEYEEKWEEMKKLAIDSQDLKARFLEGINKDTEAFNQVMEAFALPKKTEEDKKNKELAIQETTKKATIVPLNILRYSLKALELAKKAALMGNINSISDAGVSALTAYASAEGAYYNIKINLKSIKDKEFNDKIEKDANQILNKVKDMTREVRKLVLEKLTIQ